MSERASERKRVAFIAVSAWVFVVGCGSDLKTMGQLGLPSMAHLASNIFLVDTEIDGHPGGRLIADAGSPFTVIDASQFPGAALGLDVVAHCDLGFGSLVIDGVQVLQRSAVPGGFTAGLVGGDVMRDFSMGFDYRDKTLRFGDGADPEGVAEPGTSVSFSLGGGGKIDIGETVTYPATRILLDVDVEGTTHPFMLDTGASETTLRSSVFAAITADGRKVLDGLPISTVMGTQLAQVTRTRAITVGGEVVNDSAAITLDDNLLDGLTAEIGKPVDGLLGGTFMREFFVVIDYPNRKLVLHRLADRSSIVDEFVSVGMELAAASDGSYEVAAVYTGTAADMEGVSTSDVVTAIDGTLLTGVDPFAVNALLQGAVGTMHAITFGTTDVPLNMNKTLMLPVEDLIPSP